MKSRYGCLTLIVLAVIIGLAIGIGGTDINSTKDVIEDMQGSWTGYDHEGGIYTHYKLVINGNSFKGWMQSAYTDDTPNFASSPDVTGTYTLSPVQGYTNSSGKYRNINFTMEGGGFGNNSLSARSFTNMIIYDNSGLYVVGWAPMRRESGVGTWQGWIIFIGLALALFFEVKARLFGEGKVATQQVTETANNVQEINVSTPIKQEIRKPILTSEPSKSINDLHKAKELLDSGLLTQDEFVEIKKQVLGNRVPVVEKVIIDHQLKAEKVKKPINKKRLMISIGLISVTLVVIFLYRYWLIQREEANSPFKLGEDNSTPSGVETKPVDSINNSNNSAGYGNDEALADSYYIGFLSTPTGERYKKIKIQVPNNDESGTTSEIEIISPVEGLYVSNKEGKLQSIKISYDGEKIYVSHWVDSEQPVTEEAYITSKGYFSFGSQEFDYDRFGETVDDVKNLTLVERYNGEIYNWSNAKTN